MSGGLVASLRRVILTNHYHQNLLVLSSSCSIFQIHRNFSMQYKDTEKAVHPFDYINKNYSWLKINSFLFL